jgi:Transposase, Mutator family
MLERLFKEVKRRTRVVGVFPNERSASTLATEIALRSSEQWALKRYLTGRPRGSGETKPTTFAFETLTSRKHDYFQLVRSYRNKGSPDRKFWCILDSTLHLKICTKRMADRDSGASEIRGRDEQAKKLQQKLDRLQELREGG